MEQYGSGEVQRFIGRAIEYLQVQLGQPTHRHDRELLLYSFAERWLPVIEYVVSDMYSISSLTTGSQLRSNSRAVGNLCKCHA